MATTKTLGPKVASKRAGRGMREVAKEIGISPATLSRVERGYSVTLATFVKICLWLPIDPGEVLPVTKAKRKAKTEHMWGCYVKFRDGHSRWAYELFSVECHCKRMIAGLAFPFTEKRAGIMPCVRYWRDMPNVKSAVSKRVEIPTP